MTPEEVKQSLIVELEKQIKEHELRVDRMNAQINSLELAIDNELREIADRRKRVAELNGVTQ